jgi:hypothetical protein
MKIFHVRWRVTLFIVSAVLAASLFLVACGGPAPTPAVIYITATFTPGSVIRVVTATFTPAPPVLATETALPPVLATDTPLPPPPPTSQADVSLGQLGQQLGGTPVTP